VLAATFLADACSGQGGPGWAPPDLPPDCDHFVTMCESCLRTAVPSLMAFANQRSALEDARIRREPCRENPFARSKSREFPCGSRKGDGAPIFSRNNRDGRADVICEAPRTRRGAARREVTLRPKPKRTNMPSPKPRLSSIASPSERRASAVTGLLLGAVVVLGCGSRAKGDRSEAKEPIAECDAFLAAYDHCLGSLGPDRIAKARVEQTRAGLVAQASHGDAARAALRKQCTDNLSQLKATCR
jgi:hypothetical protein